MRKNKILLIGDNCKDIYVYGTINRISPEAPVPILDFNNANETGGMAKNVFNNLMAFNFDINFITNKEDIIKIRFIDDKSKHHLLRIDTNSIISPLQNIPNLNIYDCIVISDYDKGFLSYEILNNIVCQSKVPIFIDSKKNVIPQNNNCFIKINNLEYNRLINKQNYKNLIITHGSLGAEYNNIMYTTEAIEKGDVTGAGDTFFAALIFNYLNTHDIIKSIKFANKAAYIAVSHFGTYILNEKDIKCLMMNQ